MKKCKVSYVVPFLAVLCVTFAQCRKFDSPPNNSGLWQKLNTPYFGNISDMQFTSSDTGYILGIDSTLNGSAIIKTFDGGQTWQKIYFPRVLQDSNNIEPVGQLEVSPYDNNILFSLSYVQNQNVVIRSTDGGYHWKVIDTTPNSAWGKYHFFTPTNVLRFGEYISISADSGFTWNKVYASTPINAIQFPDRQVGYASFGAIFSGIAGGFFSSGILLKTSDGGNTWQTLNYPSFSEQNGEGPGIFGISFINENTGFIHVIEGGANTSSGSEIYKTMDGGNHWSIANNDMVKGYSIGNDIYMKNENEGFFNSGDGIFHTTNSCVT